MATESYLNTAGNTLVGIHNTLSGTTADTVLVEANGPQGSCRCEILNRSTINTIYVTHNGATAVAAADGTVAILPGQAITTPPGTRHVLSIVGSGDAYSVHRLPDGTVQ